MPKTIKQIAESLNCPKIKVYRYIKNNRISETFRNGSTCYYDETTVNAITSALRAIIESEAKRSETFQSVSRNDAERCETFQENNENINEMLVKALQEQLAVKDKQIEALTSALVSAQKSLSDTTAALNAAQALHAGTLQQHQLENKTDNTEKNETKKGFFKKIFKKN